MLDIVLPVPLVENAIQVRDIRLSEHPGVDRQAVTLGMIALKLLPGDRSANEIDPARHQDGALLE